MDSLIFEAPSNALSFGNVSLNLLREMHRQGIKVSYFPIGNELNLESYDSLDGSCKKWIQESYDTRFDSIKKDIPTLKLWHLNGSEMRIGSHQTLYTFYEASQPTDQEIALANLQNHTVFSSSYACEVFKEAGASSCSSVPCGFDEDFKKVNKTYLPDKIHFGLMGKWEKRKHTENIIKLLRNKPFL